ncbi:hypothetical protein AC579_5705 [Pseudocercospora musae]|uniref:Uncharacterized protein n=1 Tax=Pseudocercospora musae TaxID=113226 RepID=A0A139IS34_9PEZI|nr:hypothetical protein AC579_5705 [Pseudocercospora musae]
MIFLRQFWEDAPWIKRRSRVLGKNRQWEVSCRRVLDWQGWNGSQRDRNFLGHFARLPLTVQATVKIAGVGRFPPPRPFMRALREEIYARRAVRRKSRDFSPWTLLWEERAARMLLPEEKPGFISS